MVVRLAEAGSRCGQLALGSTVVSRSRGLVGGPRLGAQSVAAPHHAVPSLSIATRLAGGVQRWPRSAACSRGVVAAAPGARGVAQLKEAALREHLLRDRQLNAQ